MRRDAQIGVILGVVIIGIIAVFLSSRTNINKSQDKELSSNRKEKDISAEEVSFKSTDDIFEGDTFIEETFKSEIEEVVTIVDDVSEEVEVLKKEDETFAPEVKENIVEETTPVKFTTEEEIDEKTAKNEKVTTSKIIKEKKVLTHKVELNDNLSSLARRYYGDKKKWLKIYNANIDVIYDRNSLPLGEELIIPEVEILNIERYEKVAEEKPEKKVMGPTINKESIPRKHLVKRGETLYALSKVYYGNSQNWNLIYSANKDILGSKKRLLVGQRLTIPEIGVLVNKSKKNTHYVLQSQSTSGSAKNIVQRGSNKTYKIKKGDTLFKIAKEHYNDGHKWKRIYNANKKILKNSNYIPAGKTIVIP